MGINPHGVHTAVFSVCEAAVRQLDALHTDELLGEMAVNSRSVRDNVRKFTATHGSR